jgi:hypothetical protein
VLAAGALLCPRGAFTCGTGILVALVYTGPAAVAFAVAAIVGVLREPPQAEAERGAEASRPGG